MISVNTHLSCLKLQLSQKGWRDTPLNILINKYVLQNYVSHTQLSEIEAQNLQYVNVVIFAKNSNALFSQQ